MTQREGQRWAGTENRRQSPSSPSCRHQDKSKEDHPKSWLKERNFSYLARSFVLSKHLNVVMWLIIMKTTLEPLLLNPVGFC